MQMQLSTVSEPRYTTRFDSSLLTAGQERANVKAAVGRAMALFEPPPQQTVSEWAAENRVLSSETSAEPGPWRNEKAPYLVDIMDLYNDPLVREIWIMKSAQVGMTEALNNMIGYVIDRKPGPMMLIQPTVEMVEAWSKDRLQPMLEDCPSLVAKVSPQRSKDGSNTLRHKTGPGWRLSMAGANAPAGLRMRSVRDLFCDEVDVYPKDTGKDGDPIAQARKRQVTFWNRKFIAGSTPTIKGESRIEAGFESTDMRYLHLPCPHCTQLNGGTPDGYQRLKWTQMKWVDDDPNTTRYECEHCHAQIEEHHKQWMLANRKWVATKPFRGGRVGIHIWEAYSNFVTWPEIVTEFLEAKKFPETLQTWINTSLGETYVDEGNTPKAEGLLARREAYSAASIPDGVLLLTMGTDVQDDRVESTIYGWGADEQSWRIEHIVLRGDPSSEVLWAEHDEILRRRFPTDDGRELVIEACAVDSGGHYTEHVYRYCARRKRYRVWAIKGKEGVGRLAWPKKASRGGKLRVDLWIVGVDTIKELIYGRLSKCTSPGPGYLHLDASTSQEWLDQLTSEVVTFKKTRHGRKVRQYKPKTSGSRQEALDTTVYAYAAMCGRGGAALLAARVKARARATDEVPPEPEDEGAPPAPAAPAAAEVSTPTPASSSAAAAPPVAAQKQKPTPRPRRRGGGWIGGWRK